MSRLTARFHFAAFRNLFPVVRHEVTPRLFVFFARSVTGAQYGTLRLIIFCPWKRYLMTRLVRHAVVILGAMILNLSPVWNVRIRHRRLVARKFKRRGGWIGYGVHCWLVTAFKGCLPAWKDHNLSHGALGLPWLEDCVHLFCSANWRRQVLNGRYAPKLQKNEPFAMRRQYYIEWYIQKGGGGKEEGIFCGMKIISDNRIKIISKKFLLSPNTFPVIIF